MYPIVARAVFAYLLPKISRKLVNWALTSSTNQIEPGTVVLCTLLEHARHSGVYVGNGMIVHFDGAGVVEKVTPETFIKRLKLFYNISINSAVNIYVPCPSEGSVWNPKAVERAEAAIGPRPYHVLKNNCHRFTYFCLTGDDSPRTFSTEMDIFREPNKKVIPIPSLSKWNWKKQNFEIETTSNNVMESDA